MTTGGEKRDAENDIASPCSHDEPCEEFAGENRELFVPKKNRNGYKTISLAPCCVPKLLIRKLLTGVVSFFNPFTPDSAKSKTDKFSKITNGIKLKINRYSLGRFKTMTFLYSECVLQLHSLRKFVSQQ